MENNIPGSDNPNCIKCKLFEGCKKPFMSMDGAGNIDILFTGEAPGCISGDSLIDTAFRDKSIYPDGIPIKDLVGKKNFYVYSYDIDNNKLVLGLVKKAWKTGIKKIYRVTYEWSYPNGKELVHLNNSILVTSNHRFLLKQKLHKDPFKGIDHGECRYLSIDEGLCVGTSLQPFYRHNSKYSSVGCSSRSMNNEARVLLELKFNRKLKRNENSHHINRNTLDDSEDNIEVLTVSEHARIHFLEDGNPMDREEVVRKHKLSVNDEEYKSNQRKDRNEYLSDPENYEKVISDIYRTNPQRSKTVKELFQTPEFYYRYLLGRQRSLGLSDEWVYEKFNSKFPNINFNNHKVVSIEYIGETEVYDMKVEKYHNFAVNGIFVHNSEEDEQGIPFVGKSGTLLREMAAELKVNVGYTNAVRCRPKNNETPSVAQIKLCRPFVLHDIQKTSPKVVVILGNTALKSIIDQNGITSWRGKVLVKDDITFISTFHPAAMLYDSDDPSKANMQEQWLEDLDRAASIALGDAQKPQDVAFEYKLITSISELKEALNVLQEAGECSFDTEFTTVKAYATGNSMIMASFAVHGKAYALPLYHPENPMMEDIPEAIDLLEKFAISEIKKIGHNIKIDALILKSTLGIDLLCINDDVMLLSQLLDSRIGIHGLKELASKHLGMYEYDSELKMYVADHKKTCDPEEGGTYANIPLEILWKYAAKDASATLLLRDILKNELDEKRIALYEQMLIPAVSTFSRMESNGCLPDLKKLKEYYKIYTDEMSKLKNEMRKHPSIVKIEEKLREKLPAKRREEAIDLFNPNSRDQMRDLIYNYMGHEVIVRTKTGKASVSADTIKWIDDPWLDIYKLYALYSSAVTKYLSKMQGWVQGDGRIRSNYNLIGTTTGRTSSSKPNLQNIPTPEKNPGTLLEEYPIKNVFQRTWINGCLMAIDYSAMEMRMMAANSLSKRMLKMFAEGKDPHTFVASKLYRIPEEEITKEARYRAKWVNWTMLFGGGAGTLVDTYKLSPKEAKELVEGWYSVFPEVAEYNAKQVKYLHKHGYVVSPFGKRRYFPELENPNNSKEYINRLEREAMNHPIQSSASDILVMSLVVVDTIMQSHHMKSMLVNTVHDSILLDVYPGELTDLHDMCIDVMENIVDYAKEYFPAINFDWLNVPMVAEAECGHHYGEIVKYEKWITGELHEQYQ